MALSIDTTRPTSANTATETTAPVAKVYEDSANKRFQVDIYETINAAIRLEHRLLLTPVDTVNAEGITTRKIQINELIYPPTTGQVYDPTSLSSANTAPFTIAAAQSNNLIGFLQPSNLDAARTTWGDARS